MRSRPRVTLWGAALLQGEPAAPLLHHMYVLQLAATSPVGAVEVDLDRDG